MPGNRRVPTGVSGLVNSGRSLTEPRGTDNHHRGLRNGECPSLCWGCGHPDMAHGRGWLADARRHQCRARGAEEAFSGPVVRHLLADRSTRDGADRRVGGTPKALTSPGWHTMGESRDWISADPLTAVAGIRGCMSASVPVRRVAVVQLSPARVGPRRPASSRPSRWAGPARLSRPG